MSVEISKLSTKGQIVLPKSVRDKLKLSSGDSVLFIECDNGDFLVRKLSVEDQAFLKLAETSFSFWDNEVDSQYDKL